ncbi:hypothetical protein ACIQZG_22055 [Lysinibacillus sp. NPDC096418]|uniref:hypothetical protein n=1 Tax=Lysinibacillus sp. NPDC096418 TaxID=3364138 RepID=UPI00380B856E
MDIICRLSSFILLSCASILIVSMIGDLIGWLDISTDFPYGFLWFLSFWAASLNLMYQFYFKKIKLVAKRTALDFGIVTFQAYSFYGGIACILIHLNVTI